MVPLQEVDHSEERIAHRGIFASPDAIFGSHRAKERHRRKECAVPQPSFRQQQPAVRK
jgi:hypothetical protein